MNEPGVIKYYMGSRNPEAEADFYRSDDCCGVQKKAGIFVYFSNFGLVLNTFISRTAFTRASFSLKWFFVFTAL